RIFIDDRLLFNIEYPGMSKGKVGVYGSSGTHCKNIEVSSTFASSWTTNIESVSGAIAGIREFENEDKYLYLSNPTSKELYAEQVIDVEGVKIHTLSFNMSGSGNVKRVELNGDAPQTFNYVIPLEEAWGRQSFSEMI